MNFAFNSPWIQLSSISTDSSLSSQQSNYLNQYSQLQTLQTQDQLHQYPQTLSMNLPLNQSSQSFMQNQLSNNSSLPSSLLNSSPHFPASLSPQLQAENILKALLSQSSINSSQYCTSYIQGMNQNHLNQQTFSPLINSLLQNQNLTFPFNLTSFSQDSLNQNYQESSLPRSHTLSTCETIQQNQQIQGDNKISSISENKNSDSESDKIKQQDLDSSQTQQSICEQKIQSQLVFKLNDEEKLTLNSLPGINMQNAFKNILKGFISFVNNGFQKVYVYDYPDQGSDDEVQTLTLSQASIKQIEEPTSLQRKMFLQKFNKFMKAKKYNNSSIRQIIENRLYSTVLKDYIQNNSKDWLKRSTFQNKDDIIIVLQYFQLCCDNKNLLLFLSKFSDKYILQS